MRNRLLRSAGIVLGPALFLVALAVLHEELRAYDYRDIARQVSSLPAGRVLLAVGLMLASYLTLTLYDRLALAYLGRGLPYRRVALASFVAYALGNNIGLSSLSSAPVRYRIYSASGLSPLEITKLIGFCVATFWAGVGVLGGVTLILEPPVGLLPVGLSATALRGIGVFLLAGIAGYLAACVLVRRPLSFKGLEIRLPRPSIAVLQVGVATADWVTAAGVLYVLLPDETAISFPAFAGVFLVAQITGLASQVPGGLGIFETVVLLMLPAGTPPSAAVGSLLAFRAIYYLLPLMGAAVLLGTHEIRRQKEVLRGAARALGQWAPRILPQVFALSVFVGGVLLLFSGATPPVSGRMAWLCRVLPLPLIELSHFLASLAGLGLLLLARGLQRRLDAAYALAVGLLAAAAVLSLLKGGDYEEALILVLMAAALVPCRSQFYRRASLFAERYTSGWLVVIAVVLAASTWLAYFSFKHVEYSRELWWRFALSGAAPRALRATAGVVAAASLFGIARLLRPAAPEPRLPGREDLNRAAAIVRDCSRTSAHLALLGDKALLFSESGRSFLMYAVEGRSWVAMDGPVGVASESLDLVWSFRELADRHSGWTVFYQVGPDDLSPYLDLGLALLKLGEEARVPLDAFSLEGKSRKRLRHDRNQVEKDGCRLEVLPVDGVPGVLPELKRISDAWLHRARAPEKGFSLGFFHEAYLRRCPVAVVRRDARIVAFANLWPGGGSEELSVDLMRFDPEAPDGVMEYLFVELMLWGKAQGYRWFNLGMAPLSGLDDRALAPAWNRLGAVLYRHGQALYNFEGLRAFKEKFSPVWRPRYLASPGGLALPRILANLATLISRGPRRLGPGGEVVGDKKGDSAEP